MSVIAHRWYRIDKGDGRIVAVHKASVIRAARAHYGDPALACQVGRFSTPCAIYTRGDQLTADEQTTMRGLPAESRT